MTLFQNERSNFVGRRVLQILQIHTRCMECSDWIPNWHNREGVATGQPMGGKKTLFVDNLFLPCQLLLHHTCGHHIPRFWKHRQKCLQCSAEHFSATCQRGMICSIFFVYRRQIDWDQRLHEPLPSDSSAFKGVYTIIDGFPCSIFQPSQNQQAFYSGTLLAAFFSKIWREGKETRLEVSHCSLCCHWEDCLSFWSLSWSQQWSHFGKGEWFLWLEAPRWMDFGWFNL